MMSNNFWDEKLEEAEKEPLVKQSIFTQEPLTPKEAEVNPTMETSNRLIEMENIDVAKLDEDYSKTSHHFPNIPLIIIDVIFTLAVIYFLTIEQNFLYVVVFGFVSSMLVLFLFATHVRIDHYETKGIYVWYRGFFAPFFVYQKQHTDRLDAWYDTTTSTDSEGNTSTTAHFYFRIEDKYGNELLSGQGAGAGSKGLHNRNKLFQILGLPDKNNHSSNQNSQFDSHSSSQSNANSKSRFLINLGGFFLVPLLFFGFIITADMFIEDDWNYYGEDAAFYCSNDGEEYAYDMGGISCPEGYGVVPMCPNGEPCFCIDTDEDCFDGDDDWGYLYYSQDYYYDRYCSDFVSYPVTTPIEIVSVKETGSNQPNLAEYPINELSYAINGGVCDYEYYTSEAFGFEFNFNLVNTSDIDGVSILLIEEEWFTSGYSGIEIFTMGDNDTEWTKQYSSDKMFGSYERYATYEEQPIDFGQNMWFRHAFNETVTNVSQVKIVTGVADQNGGASVSFTGLRVDGAGDYAYPDYFLCNGEWDGRFENSTSQLDFFDDIDRYMLSCV
jgi:hypothetical protein